MLKEPKSTLLLMKYAASRNLASREGYQWYEDHGDYLTPHTGSKTAIKSNLIRPFMKQIVRDKTVLDIGCDKGYFSWLALDVGARSVMCNDIHASVIKYLKPFCKLHKMDVLEVDIFRNEINLKFDVTMAFAMIHQVGLPLDQVIHKIHSMTRESSIIEFCGDYSEKFGDSWNLDYFKSVVLSHYSSLEVLCQYDAIGDYKGQRYICHACCSH